MRAKVVRTVGLLREEGPSLREPYSKHLEDGIFEIRTKFIKKEEAAAAPETETIGGDEQ